MATELGRASFAVMPTNGSVNCTDHEFAVYYDNGYLKVCTERAEGYVYDNGIGEAEAVDFSYGVKVYARTSSTTSTKKLIGTIDNWGNWTATSSFKYDKSYVNIYLEMESSSVQFVDFKYQSGASVQATNKTNNRNFSIGVYTEPPVVKINSVTTPLYAGMPTTITYTWSDIDDTTAYNITITRYYKEPGSSSYKSNIFYASSSDCKSQGQKTYTDTLPSTFIEGTSVYYTVTVYDATDRYESGEDTSSVYTVQKIPNVPPTVSFNALPTLYAGKSVTISWSTYDADGDAVYTVSLIRYHKAKGASNFTATTLNVTDTSKTSYTDTIPDIKDGQVYYVITVRDAKNATASDDSDTGTVLASCNIAISVNGTIVEASDIAVVVNGVITAHLGELHTVIGGTII